MNYLPGPFPLPGEQCKSPTSTTTAVGIGLIYWMIHPKLRAISAEYEEQQAQYVKELENRLRWQDDGEASHG